MPPETDKPPIDWSAWQGEIHATLMFIVKEGHILLIEKKRGLGAGKINGPGGKIDPGETPLEAVIRETQEELLITPINSRKLGELWFSMSDCPDILCHVYRADDHEGEPTETEEAVPVWTPLHDIPWHRMWEDDRHWLPLLLEETTFHGRFVFSGETMRWMDMRSGIEW
jgi:8-oxo-dGTP diphosphatase